ncbi:MAG: glycosyl transferase [Alphaproteobacteria bacterium]|nr:glycosyl transferase [Alphaproteobacteria bacterium]
MSARVFIWVQHLLGMGHYSRASALASALRDDGFAVTLVTGGVTPPNIAPSGAVFVQLPPARAKDELFDELVDETGTLVDQCWHETRREALLAAFEQARPDVVITETFPFGRRLLNFELHTLIEAARARHPKPLIVASLRDILQRPRKTNRAIGMVEYARANYDALLVHGDPSVVRLEESFAETASLSDLIRYTGYVCAELPRSSGTRDEILASAGGGAAGKSLIQIALNARDHSRNRGRPWTFVTGPLGEEGPPSPGNVTVVRSLPDFRSHLAAAAVSVSQAGYNTLVEAVAAGTPTLAVPFETDREKEQRLRAEKFAARGWIRLMHQPELTPQSLAAAIDTLIDRQPVPANLDIGGGPATGKILRSLLQRS